MTRIAVIIVNYNGGDLLQQALAALAVQTMPPTQVLVMDNASTDGSLDACARAFPWAEYHRLPQNVGFARANNLGVERASGCDWIALLNPDAFPEPTWIEALDRGTRSYPDTEVFACAMISAVHRDITDGAGDAYRVDGLAWPRYQGEPITRMPRSSEDVFAPSGGAALYKRDRFVAAGGFCERFFCYYEDVDLGFRLQLRGCRCRYLPDAVVYHMGSALTGGQASAFSVYHVHRNFVWTFVRNMPGRFFWLYLPAHIAANLTTVALFVRKGYGRAILRAKRDALLGLWQTLRERKDVQAGLAVPPAAVIARMQRGNLLTTLVGRATRWLRTARQS